MNLLKLFKCVVITGLGVQGVCQVWGGWGLVVIFALLSTLGNGSWVDEQTFWAPAWGCSGEPHEYSIRKENNLKFSA